VAKPAPPIKTRSSTLKSRNADISKYDQNSFTNLSSKILEKLVRLYTNLFAADSGDIDSRSALLSMMLADQIWRIKHTGSLFDGFCWLIASTNCLVLIVRVLRISVKSDNLQTVSSFGNHAYETTGKHSLSFTEHCTYLFNYLVFEPFYSNISLLYAVTSPYIISPEFFQRLCLTIAIAMLSALYAILPGTLANLNIQSKSKRPAKMLMARLMGPSIILQIALYSLAAMMTNERSVASLIHVDHIIVHNFVELFILI